MLEDSEFRHHVPGRLGALLLGLALLLAYLFVVVVNWAEGCAPTSTQPRPAERQIVQSTGCW